MSNSGENGVVRESIYIYTPNNVAPVIFAAAFAVSGSLHLWQTYHYRSFKWTSLLPLSCFVFAAGFALREYGAFHYTLSRTNVNVYVASVLLIYVSPPILELQNYHTLGRVLYYVPYLSPLHPGRVLTTFGILSAVVEVLNALGISYSAGAYLPDHLIRLGRSVTKASLILQVAVIALYFLLAGVFHYRCVRAGILSRRVQGPLTTLYVSMSLILVRCIYRLVENFSIDSAGTNFETLSPIQRYEWYFWVFEATLMLINSVLWNLRHPRRYLPADKRVYIAQDGMTEIEGPGWDDDRTFLMTVCDPFGMLKTRKTGEKQVPFWEMDGHAVPAGAAGAV